LAKLTGPLIVWIRRSWKAVGVWTPAPSEKRRLYGYGDIWPSHSRHARQRSWLL